MADAPPPLHSGPARFSQPFGDKSGKSPFRSGCMRGSAQPSDEAKARAVAWLTAWDSQGAHRTATPGDEAGALWLASEAAKLRVEVATEVFALDRLDPVDCYLDLDGQRISAVPAF